MQPALGSFQISYNQHRPHDTLGARTPAEVLAGDVPQRRAAATAPCRAPRDRAPPHRLALVVTHVGGFRELPVVELRRAA